MMVEVFFFACILFLEKRKDIDEYAKEWFFVRKANSGFELGYYSDGWMTTNEKYWRPYTGEIVLVNK